MGNFDFGYSLVDVVLAVFIRFVLLLFCALNFPLFRFSVWLVILFVVRIAPTPKPSLSTRGSQLDSHPLSPFTAQLFVPFLIVKMALLDRRFTWETYGVFIVSFACVAAEIGLLFYGWRLGR